MDYQPQNTQADDIDLRELLRSLWSQKLLIIVCTVVVTCIAAAYVFLATPIYETTAQTLPPTGSDLAGYNVAGQLTGEAVGGITQSGFNRSPAGIGTLTTGAAYDSFLKYLASDTVREMFFEKYYLPAHKIPDDPIQIQRLRAKLESEIVVTTPKKPNELVAKISMRGVDPVAIATWTNAYVKLAQIATCEELLENLAAEVQIRQKSVADQIATLRRVAQTNRDVRITRLRSALAVAKSIGLDSPPNSMSLISIGGFTAAEMDNFTDGSMLYLRGSRALLSELEQLEKRNNNDAYIPELPNLLKTQALLQSIDLHPKNLSPATIDRAAPVPNDPIKPKKILILALGLIFGGMLGVFWAAMRQIFK